MVCMLCILQKKISEVTEKNKSNHHELPKCLVKTKSPRKKKGTSAKRSREKRKKKAEIFPQSLSLEGTRLRAWYRYAHAKPTPETHFSKVDGKEIFGIEKGNREPPCLLDDQSLPKAFLPTRNPEYPKVPLPGRAAEVAKSPIPSVPKLSTSSFVFVQTRRYLFCRSFRLVHVLMALSLSCHCRFSFSSYF